MRLRRLTMSGIGPFRGEEVVDFHTLTRSGLFLIEGPTGAGKSTIIDAITYALYGSVAGGRESTTERIRSDLADPTTPSYVELEFDISGSTYVVRRQPAYSRPKLRGEGLMKENAKQSLRALDGSMEPITDAKEIAAEIQRLLGLSVEHFRKLVVLPQGEFDALLRATPADRFEVLGRLIDDGFMHRVQEELVSRGRDAEAQLAGIRARIQEVSSTLCSRAQEAIDDTPDSESLSTEDVEGILAALRALVRQAQLRVESLAGPADVAAEAALLASTALSRAQDGAAALTALAGMRAALPAPLQSLPADRLRQRRTQLAEALARLEPFVAWEADETARSARTRELEELARAAQESVETLRDQARTMPGRRADLEQRRQQAALIAATADQHRTEAARLEGLAASATELRAREVELEQSAAQAALLKEAAETSRTALVSAREHRVTLLERRLAHSAADLAARLHDDEECPVCGATQHPRLAVAPHAGLVSDAELESAESAVAQAEQRDAEAQSAWEAAQASLAEAQSGVDALRGQLAGSDPATLDAALSATRESVAHAEAAAGLSRELQTQLDELDRQAAVLGDQLTSAMASAAEAQTHASAHAARIAQEAEALLQAVGTDTTATAMALATRSESATIDAFLDAAEATAGLDPDVDINALQTAAAAAESAAQGLAAQLEQARADLTRLSSTLTAVESLAQRWSAAHSEIATALADTETAVALGTLASAQSKANTLRLTLQSYAVQRRFRTVLDAATRHLERMSAGHFAFELDETVGRGQSGLGIAVRDQWSGTVRDPKALSGGETFIASLALALGLADVVREENGGVDLQTLFVDEGFGSLDQESLQQVLDQLDALRSRGRVVGVISHVTEMKDWVHDRVIVEAGPPGKGSRLVQPT